MRWLLLLLLAVGCGADPDEPPGSTGPPDAGPTDVQIVFGSPDADTGVSPADTPEPPDTTEDLGAPDSGPTDTPAAPDVEEPADVLPDAAPDVPMTPDTGPDVSDIGGSCVCGAGSICQGGQCVPCDQNAYCGSGCVNCASFGQICSGGLCAQCDATTPCPAGKQCVAGACQACTTDQACGPTCAPCDGDTPTCQGTACVCTPGSCGAGTTCVNGACVPCNLAQACGPSCVDCTKTGMPSCVDGACQCTADAQCGAGKHCVGGTCVACGQNDPDHCGPSCTVCGGATPVCSAGTCVCSDDSCPAGQWCGPSGACQPCDDSAHCGPKCLPCGGGLPWCVSGACKECLTDAHCGAGTWCSGNSCAPCGDSDPAHCGPSCDVCSASEQCAGGQCVPKPCSAQGCSTDVGPDAKTCAKARIVGRTNAQGGFLVQHDTTGGGNNDDLPSALFGSNDCWDAKYDHFYKIWLFAGETITVTASPLDYDFDIMLKLYQGLVCDSEETLIGCANDKGDEQAETFVHTAPQDGWVTMVVDGPSAFSDEWDYGKYGIAVKLTCADADCCCGP